MLMSRTIHIDSFEIRINNNHLLITAFESLFDLNILKKKQKVYTIKYNYSNRFDNIILLV